ncbi:MAG: beta strand repeat-containing protein, partial [Gaiellaceae bacterium]
VGDSANNIVGDETILQALETALKDAGHPLTTGKYSTNDTLAPQYTNFSGTKNLKKGDTVLVGTTVYVFVHDDADNAVLGNETYTDTSRWKPGLLVNIHKGDTVRVASTGLSYSWTGSASFIDLAPATQDYANSSNWAYMAPTLRVIKPNEVWQLVSGNDVFLITKNGTKFEVSKPTIDAVAVAAALALSIAGEVSVGIAGAGAYAANDISGKTNAYADGSVLSSKHDVTLTASSAASIVATVVGASAALGVGLTTAGIGASIGIAISENHIGTYSGTTRVPLEIRAYLLNSAVEATGDLSLSASGSQTISAVVVAASVAAAAGLYAGVAVSGAGSITTNVVVADVQATITGKYPLTSTIRGIKAASVTLSATDTSRIKVDAVGASLAAALGIVGVAVSVAVTLAHNTIDNDIAASISGVSDTVTADKVAADTGDVSLTATSNETIQALAVAASLAASGGAVAASLSGAGAAASNVILTKTNAFIEKSDVKTTGTTVTLANPTPGDVTLLAQNASTVRAVIVGVSVAFAVGAVAVGVSIGVSIADNLIGWKDSETEQAAEVQAYIAGSSVDATGNLSLTANANETIDALVLAISVAVAGGGIAGGFTGAGSAADNRITTHVKAFVAGVPASAKTVHAASVAIAATDTSRITANVAAASVGLAAGLAGVTISIAVSIATNYIANRVEAYVKDVADLTTTSGSVTLSASTGGAPLVSVTDATFAAKLNDAVVSDGKVDSTKVTALKTALPTLHLSDIVVVTSLVGGTEWVLRDVGNARGYIVRKTAAGFDVFAVTIDAVSVAASIGIAATEFAGVAASGAGAVANNTILTRTNAYIQTSDVTTTGTKSATNTTAGDVTLTATSTAGITATIVAASIAVGVGSLGGVALSIGVAIANNWIGSAPLSGSSANHKVSDGTATVSQGQTVFVDAGTLTGRTFEYIGAATLVGANLGAQNFTDTTKWREVRNQQPAEVQAYIADSSVDASGDLFLHAISHQTIASIVVAGSAAVAVGGGLGLGGAGAGASSVNSIGTTVAAFIDGDGTTGIEAKTITLTAEDTSTIRADVGAVAVSFAFGTVSVAVSIAVALAQNTISNHVEAFIRDADDGVTADTGAVALSATESATIVALSVAAAVAASGSPFVAVGVSGAGADAKNVILTAVKAFAEDSSLTTKGTAAGVSLTASDTSAITATIVAVSAAVAIGLVGAAAFSVGAAIAHNLIGWDYEYTTADGTKSIALGDKVRLADDYTHGGNPSAVYRYIGSPARIDLGIENYGNTMTWVEDGPNQVKAYLSDTSVDATGALELSATAMQTITAVVAAGSMAIAGGTGGFAGSGAGAQTVNKIATVVQAYIDGDGADGIKAASVSVKAHETATITATTAGVSLALSFAIGAAVSIAVALAENDIGTHTDAYITNTDKGVTTTSGGVTIEAISQSQALFDITSPPTGTQDALNSGVFSTDLKNAFSSNGISFGSTDVLKVVTLSAGAAWELLSTLTGRAFILRWDAGTVHVSAASISAYTISVSAAGGVGG